MCAILYYSAAAALKNFLSYHSVKKATIQGSINFVAGDLYKD